MSVQQIVLLLVGLVTFGAGLSWFGQGTGVFRHPADSYMIDQMEWAWRGVALAAVGLVLLVVCWWF